MVGTRAASPRAITHAVEAFPRPDDDERQIEDLDVLELVPGATRTPVTINSLRRAGEPEAVLHEPRRAALPARPRPEEARGLARQAGQAELSPARCPGCDERGPGRGRAAGRTLW